MQPDSVLEVYEFQRLVFSTAIEFGWTGRQPLILGDGGANEAYQDAYRFIKSLEATLDKSARIAGILRLSAGSELRQQPSKATPRRELSSANLLRPSAGSGAHGSNRGSGSAAIDDFAVSNVFAVESLWL